MTPGFEGRSFGTCLPSSAGELWGGPLPRWPDGFLGQIPALSAHELPGRSMPMSCCLPLAADLIIFTALLDYQQLITSVPFTENNPAPGQSASGSHGLRSKPFRPPLGQ